MDAVQIPLQNGMVALVDAADYERVSQYKWHATACGPRGQTKYYVRTKRKALGPVRVSLHRFVMDAKPGEVVDHINGDTMDNRRSNLRITDHAGNCRNVGPRMGRRFKGVYGSSGRYVVQLRTGVPGERVGKGGFHTEEEAAKYYDELVVKYFGKTARLNFPHEHLVNTEGK